MPHLSPVLSRCLVLASLFLFSGCAYFINGSTQNVPIKLPAGMIIFDSSNDILPIRQEVIAGDTISYLQLDRKSDYDLRLRFKETDRYLMLHSTFDPQWLALDIIFTPMILVDLGTHSFNFFRGFELRTLGDTGRPSGATALHEYEPARFAVQSMGLVLRASTGHSLLSSSNALSFVILVPNEVELGAGFAFSDRLSLMGTWSFSSGVEPLPTLSKYSSTNPESYSIQVLGHYSFYRSLFIELSGGESNFTSDRISAADPQLPEFRNWRQRLPTWSVAFGLGGSTAYVDLKYTRGLATLHLPDGESSHYQQLSLGFGFNLRVQ